MSRRSTKATVVIVIAMIAGLAELVARFVALLERPTASTSLAFLAIIGFIAVGLILALRPDGAAESGSSPTSIPTPVSLPRRPETGGDWSTTSTPWPGAREEDPDGTVIRPPRR